jgi:hypothetical protein
LLEGYFSLGANVEEIRAAQDELAERHDLEELIRLFFAHPVWPVREAAATVLSSIVELDTRRLAIIESLLEDPNWRVAPVGSWGGRTALAAKSQGLPRREQAANMGSSYSAELLTLEATPHGRL